MFEETECPVCGTLLEEDEATCCECGYSRQESDFDYEEEFDENLS